MLTQKNICRRISVLAVLAIVPILFCRLHANPIKGYIITKDNLRLTGSIGRIENFKEQNRVLYINDFGSPYSLSPELIRGFAFVVDDREILYESRTAEDLWLFLRVLSRGEGMTLFADPIDGVQSFEKREVSFEQANDHSYRFYLQVRRRIPFKVKRIGYRKQLKPLMQRRAPEIAEKLGEPGYRYRDLPEIIEAYNDIYRKTRLIM